MCILLAELNAFGFHDFGITALQMVAIEHVNSPHECGVVFLAFKDVSPLTLKLIVDRVSDFRERPLGSTALTTRHCLTGPNDVELATGHQIMPLHT